jgi:hypothetical protein
VPGGTQESGGSRIVFAYGTGTLCGWLFNTILLTIRLITSIAGPTTPTRQAGPVWAFPRSLATTSGMISFPLGTKMFQFPRFPSPGLCVQPGDDARDLRPGDGFPHSDIPGSQPAHGSPRLIAVFRVLHRHLAPRHPPYALSSLTHVMRRNRRSSSRYSVVKVRCSAHHRPRPPPGMVTGRLQASRPSWVRPPGSVAQSPRPRSRMNQPHRQISPAHNAGLPAPGRTCRLPYSVRAATTIANNRRLAPRAQVEMRGLEPLTSALQKQRSPS